MKLSSPAQAMFLVVLFAGLLMMWAIDASASLPDQNQECWSCHSGYHHVAEGTATIDCYTAGCHAFGEWGAPGETSFADVEDDHGIQVGVEQYFDCVYCHNPSYPAVLQHTNASLAAAHDTTVGFEGCGDCHSAALIIEHADQCDICHQSSSPDVIAAVAAWDGSCGHCHNVGSAHVAFHDGGLAPYAGEGCEGCHMDNISVEHADDCGVCHASADPVVESAITSGLLACGACHNMTASHLEVHESGTANPTCARSGCHDANLVTTHDDCATCHSSTNSAVINAIQDGVLACTACHSTAHFRWSSPNSYRSWDDAVWVMQSEGTDPGSPHGGYTATTVKCAVCHSVHRAATPQTTAGVGAYWKLTPGGNSCIACHTATGSNPSALLVEWPSVYANGGPHNSFNCMGQCHAGVHGGIASEYGSAAKFLLNPNRRAGTTNGYGGMDAGLTAAITAGNIGGGVTQANLVTWPAAAASQQGVRAMVTGYLCGQAGCHTGSQFAVNADGYAEGRTMPANATNGPYDQFFTGHDTGSARTSCSSSGCHAVAGDRGDSKCATCHDFKGVVTNTSAWPHANRGIDVYEWIRPSGNLEVTTTAVSSGNLWMYAGDVTFRDEFGEPTQTAMWDGFLVGYGPISVQGYESEWMNTKTVLQGNAAFNLTVGTPGNIQDGVCLKCHGYKYWPYHGGDPGDESFGDPSSPDFDRSFANY